MSDSYKVYASKDEVLPTSGGTMSGQLNIGTVNNEEGIVLQFGRKLDEDTKATSQSYLTGSGIYKTDVWVGGEIVNLLALDNTSTRFGKPLEVGSGGTGANNAIDARANLEITPANIGAASVSALTDHNVATDAHNDIRLLVTEVTETVNNVLNSTDVDLDTLSEIVDYIKDNRDLLDGVTTSKVNVTDIVDNLTTNVANKPLSAAQGVALKGLIDAIVIPTVPVQSVNGKIGAVELNAADVHALATTGGTLTGALGLGTTGTATVYPMSVKKLGTDGVSKYEMQYTFSGADEGNVSFYKDGTMANRMVLGEARTTFKVPVSVDGGGTGASTPANARANLGITPGNIGALPTAGGTMAGNLNMGTTSASDSRILTFGRTMSDGVTKAQTQTYLTGGGTLKTDLYHDGVAKNSIMLASDHVRFNQPITIGQDGPIVITAAGSTTTKHTLFSDKNLPTAEQISGLEAYINALIDARLPAVTSADNGKFLQVVDGAWSAITIENAENVTY